MPIPTTAELTDAIAFPDEAGTPLWQERRTVPVVALYGVPLAFTVVVAFAAEPLVVRTGAAMLAAALALLLLRARRRSLIETLTVTDRYVTVEQPGGGRVALPVSAITALTLKGDKVRIDSTVGSVTFGFVRRRKSLVRALQQVAPTMLVNRDMDAFCPT